jgi:hypothetical protein
MKLDDAHIHYLVSHELGTIDVLGHDMESSATYRNIGANPAVAFVVDDAITDGPSGVRYRLFTMRSVFGDSDAPIVVELAQNQIYKAFREVGRVMRTVALLRFLADSKLRARVIDMMEVIRQPGCRGAGDR